MLEEIKFPSEAWFERLATIMREDASSFRRLGPVECTMIVKVHTAEEVALFEVAFASFRVRSIRRLQRVEDAAPDHFVVDAPLDTWREMLENIRSHGAPDLTHTLNYLTFPDDPMLVSGPDQLQIDAFYRYNQSLQRFFNGAAQVATRYTQ